LIGFDATIGAFEIRITVMFLYRI